MSDQQSQDGSDIFPLSAQQAFILGRAPAGEAPVAGLLLTLPAGWDAQRAEAAVAAVAVAGGEEILRTRYVRLPGLKLPVQWIQAEPACAFRVVEADDLPVLIAQAKARLAAPDGPLLVADLLRGTGGTVRLFLAASAASLDQASLALLARRILGLEGVAGSESGEALQYADYAAWQNELRGGELGRQGQAFWQGVLAGGDGIPGLPFERVGDGAAPGASAGLRLDGLADRLSRAAAALETAEEPLLLFLWNAFLARVTGAGRFIAGCAVDGRRDELRETVGRFARTLPVLVAADPAASLSDNWQAFRKSLDDSLSWQDCLNDPDLLDGRGRPCCLSVLVREEPDPYGVRVLPDEPAVARLSLGYGAEGLRLSAADGRIDPAMPALWLEQLAAFLDGALADLDQPLGRVGLLGPAARSRALAASEGAPLPAEDDAVLLHELFEAQAAAQPERIAVAAGGSRLSYRELDRRANRVADALRAAGLRAEQAVGVHLGRSAETVVAILGILKAGGAYLPLDPTYPAERLAFMLADSRARHLLVLEPPPAGLLPAEGGVEVLSLAADAPLWRADDRPVPVTAVPGGLAYVIYTSGSTGTPKGVMVSHANALASTRAREAFYPERVERFLLLSSFSFDSSVAGLFWTLAQGGALHLPDEQAQRDPAGLAGEIGREEISHYLALPSLHAQILEQLGPNRLACVIVAGEACPAELPARHAEALPGVALVNEYGPTEGTVWCTGWRADPTPADSAVPIGRPIPGARVLLLDADLEPVPAGVQGEIYVGGPGVTRGYLRRPELTAERFLPDPHAAQPGERLYRTGDLGRLRPDGAIEYLGRADQQIKIRGYRVELGEIEAALRRVEGVRDAAVVARDAPAGKQLVGFLLPEDGVEGAALGDRCRAALAERMPLHMVPARLHPLAQWPRTPNGKLDRTALAALDSRSREYVAPRSELERVLARVWQEALGVERVGVHDNFFELGGHSLLATRLRSRLQAELGVELPLRLFFEGQTLERFAAQAEAHRGKAGGTADALESLFAEVESR